MSSITNFVNFLNTMPKQAQPFVAPETSPITADDIRILQIIGTAGLLYPPDLVKLTGIMPEVAAEKVERLRLLNQLELVKKDEETSTLLLRLTPAGYATLKL